jgi:cellulose synthase/poly-beta-1,6-N-acetylglucosamine synthase-like glycosyltransferase
MQTYIDDMESIMNGISKHRKFISVILIFVILIQMPGCVSTKVINSLSDIPVSEKYTYIIHSQTTKYQLLNARFSNGTISGNLINGKQAQRANSVHFYLLADSVLKPDSDMRLVLPFDKISKIELVSPAIGATAILFGGAIIAILFIGAVISVNGGYNGL